MVLAKLAVRKLKTTWISEMDIMKVERTINFLEIAVLCFCFLFSETMQAATPKILVVMSYEEDNRWSMEIREGVESILADMTETTYFYMDTKIDIEGGEKKAKEAYALFKKIQPDGVIAADDNAQRLFVVPYLKNKVEVPVMFCGVNAEAGEYGYPASNVSGILERGHVRESIALAKQLVPSIKTIAFLAKKSPSGSAIFEQIKRESSIYPIVSTTFSLLKNSDDLLAVERDTKSQHDAFYVDGLEGMQDSEGNVLGHGDIISILASTFGKPIIGANQYHVEQGALCAVIKTGQEQGKTSAKMLLRAIYGKPVSDIPIVRNYHGKRVINVTVLNSLNVTPRPIVLLGAKLLKTDN